MGNTEGSTAAVEGDSAGEMPLLARAQTGETKGATITGAAEEPAAGTKGKGRANMPPVDEPTPAAECTAVSGVEAAIAARPE
jgi:hypothetical protein